MVERRYGEVINITSIAGLGTGFYPGQSNYTASKAGVIQLTRVCAQELGPYGINVNAIAPTLIITDTSYPENTERGRQMGRREGGIGGP